MMSQFYQYVYSFYGKDGLYPMGVTLHDIEDATMQHIDSVGTKFEGDSTDREAVRDILITDFGYVWPVGEEQKQEKIK